MDRTHTTPVPHDGLGETTQVVRGVMVTDEVLSIDEAVRATSTRRVGGLALFVGLVRDLDQGQAVTSLDYQAHPLATQRLREVVETIVEGRDVETAWVSHRTGHLQVGDIAVVVAVGAQHRAEAITTCHALIDEVKRQVPIWKQQFVVDGDPQWVGL